MPRPKDGYRLKDGSEVPGVTSVTNRFMDRSALMHWAFKQGKSGAATLYQKMHDGAEVGTCVHDMIAYDLQGKTDEVIFAYAKNMMLPDEKKLDQAMMSFHAYRAWKLQFSFRVVEQEVSLVSEKHKYGGTIDTAGVVGNQLALLDYKTGSGIYCDQLLQMAAYGQLWNEARPDSPLTGGFHLIRLDRETGEFFHYYYPKLPQALHQFLLFRKCYDLDKMLKDPKALAGAPVEKSLRKRKPRRAKPTVPSDGVLIPPPYKVNMVQMVYDILAPKSMKVVGESTTDWQTWQSDLIDKRRANTE